MQKLKDKRTALITGASSGIGLELARILAHQRWDLVLVGRDVSKLAALSDELSSAHPIQALVFPADLSLPGAAEGLHKLITDAEIHVDALVNNAGVGLFGPFAESNLHAELGMIELNAVSLTALTRLFLPGMLAKGEGRILNLASTAGFMPGPLMAVYYATKAYVISFSEALANELQGSGVTVTTLCPGATRTGFALNANMEASNLFQGEVMDPVTVAHAGYEGMMKGRGIVVPGTRNKLMVWLARLVPVSYAASLARHAQERPAALPPR